MTTLIHCPTCWPLDLGEYDTHHRCRECGTPVLVAGLERQVQLLEEQNAALSQCLREAMEWFEYFGIGSPEKSRPVLRLVHSRSERHGQK